MRQTHSTMRRQPRGQALQPPIVAELEAIFATLPDDDLLDLLKGPRRRGPRGYNPRILWRCYVTYYVLGLESVSALIRFLRNNPYVAHACGIMHPSVMPSQPTFSRFGSRLAKRWNSVAVKRIQTTLTRRLYARLPDFGATVAIDSTHMKAWSHGVSVASRRAPSDRDAGWVVKTNTEGNKQYVWGYKCHILCDAKYELPIVVDISRGNLHDINKASPLLRQLREWHRVNPKYVLADSGYSSESLRQLIRKQYRAVPVIDPHPRHLRAVKRQETIRDWRIIYRQRTAVERLNSRLKAFYKLDAIRVRGKMKVRVHTLLAVIALQARALAFPHNLRRCVARAA